MNIYIILLCIIISGCATKSSMWVQKETNKYTDEQGKEQIEIIDVKYIKIEGSGKADFKNETIDGKIELIPKELVSVSGSKIVNE